MVKFLVIFLSIIYLVRLLGKWFLRKWVSNLSKQQQSQTNNHKKEGEVTINYTSNKDSNRNSSEGEYVDYEEVK